MMTFVAARRYVHENAAGLPRQVNAVETWGSSLLKAILYAFTFAVPCVAEAAEEWKLKKESGPLKIYNSEVANSSYKAVRVEGVIKGKCSQVVAVLFDVERHKDWVFNDKGSKLLKRIADNEIIYYSEVSVPWPCSNRDFISHLKVTQSSPGVITIVSSGAPSLVPEKEGIVRVKTSSSRWTITAIGNDMIHIDYVAHFDPGGSVPAWLTNTFIVKGPGETFQQLQKQMNMPAYRDAHFDFINEQLFTAASLSPR